MTLRHIDIIKSLCIVFKKSSKRTFKFYCYSYLVYYDYCIYFSLPLSVTTRTLNTLDIPILLVHLVENPPWTRQKNGKVLKESVFSQQFHQYQQNEQSSLTSTN
jgi:hypothetical protein